jgi:hypothetical protein
VFFATYISGVYIERASEQELREAVAVRTNFQKIFAEPVDLFGKARLQ